MGVFTEVFVRMIESEGFKRTYILIITVDVRVKVHEIVPYPCVYRFVRERSCCE